MSSQLRQIAPKRKLIDMSTPCSSDAADGHRDHLEVQVLERYNRNEPLGSGKDPGLTLYIWQDPHQSREVESDYEDDEWRGPSGSLLGSDVLARRYHSSDFGPHAQETRQKREIVTANTPTGTQPRYPTAQESQQDSEIGPENGPTGTEPRYRTARESRKELEIVPATRPKRVEPITRADNHAQVRVRKYGRRQATATLYQAPMSSYWGLDSRAKDFVWQHSTDQLTKFDPNRPYYVKAVNPKHPLPRCIFYTYKGYHLCMDPNITSALEVPQLPVRLDDRLVALVYEGFPGHQRARLWPSEFERNGMVRRGRIPLGHAAKHEYKVGDIDFDGNILQPGEEGWFYLWLGGVHCLMGKEGMDAGRFQPRDRETRITGFAFRKSHRAEIQAPPGVESER